MKCVLLEPFLCRMPCVHDVTVLLHDPVSLKIKLTDRCPVVFFHNALVRFRIHCSINDDKLTWPRCSITNLNKDITTPVFQRQNEVLMLECSAVLSPHRSLSSKMSSLVSSIHKTFSQIILGLLMWCLENNNLWPSESLCVCIYALHIYFTYICGLSECIFIHEYSSNLL